MHSLWQEVRYGLRMLARNPGFTAVAVLTLALGIGANTAIFSLLNQVLLRQLPVKNPGELVLLRSPGPIHGRGWSDGDISESWSYPMYKKLRDQNSALSGLLARYSFAASISAGGETQRSSGELVSGNYFQVLGVQPALGRLFTLEDESIPAGNPVVVLSHSYWVRRFGGQAAVLNQNLLVNNRQLTIVGVSQEGFTGIQVGETPDLFVPISMKIPMLPNWDTGSNTRGLEDWNDYYMAVLGRLRPGNSREQAEASLNMTYHPLLEEQLATIQGWPAKTREKFLNKKIVLSSGARGRTTLQRDSGDSLTALGVMVAVVLLMACANVGNLLLARGAARQREFGIRVAMGASRWRMVRQLLMESLLYALAGGLLGLVFAQWTMNLLIPAIADGQNIGGLSTRMDGTLLLFALAATLVSGILFGIVPALRVTRHGVSQTLKDQGTSTSAGMAHVRFRKLLVAAQVAFTLLLLVGAGLFVRSLWNLRRLDIGLKTENVLAFSIEPALSGYSTERTIALCDQLRDRMAGFPGVTAVGTSVIPTLTGSTSNGNITVPGAPNLSDEEKDASYDSVSPGYFSTLGVPLLAGREFNAGDTAVSQRVAIVSEAMVRRFYPGRNPIGERFAWGGGKVTPDIEIVGVVKDVKQANVRAQIRPYIYQPYAQNKELGEMTFYAHTQLDPLSLAPAVRRELQQLDANLPLYDLKTMERILDENLLAERMVAGLSASFGILAALLAALGIYGVLAYSVLQRTREIGIRMALGAEVRHVRLLVLREAGLMLILGTAAGLPLGYGLARLSESLLYGVQSRDPFVYTLDVALIALVALAACYLPVRRATRVDPIVALRYE